MRAAALDPRILDGLEPLASLSGWWRWFWRSFFSSPDMPDPPPPQPQPTADTKEVGDAAARERAALRQRRGRSSTVLTGPYGPSGGGEATGGPRTVLGGAYNDSVRGTAYDLQNPPIAGR